MTDKPLSPPALKTRAQMRAEFWQLARTAMAAGKLTRAQANTICRPGTRKAGYWANHLHNLREYLKVVGFVQPPVPEAPKHEEPRQA